MIPFCALCTEACGDFRAGDFSRAARALMSQISERSRGWCVFVLSSCRRRGADEN